MMSPSSLPSPSRPNLVIRSSQWLTNLALRTKLLLAFLVTTLLSITIVSVAITQTMQSTLMEQASGDLRHHAEVQAKATATLLNQQVDLMSTFALGKLLQDEVAAAANAYTGDRASIHAQITKIDQQWTAAADSDPLIQQRISSSTASDLQEYQRSDPYTAEMFITDKYGALIAAAERTSDYDQSDEDWWRAAYNDGQGALYIGQPTFDQSSNTLGIIIAVPIYAHNTNEVIGILRATYNLAGLAELLKSAKFGQTGDGDLLLPSGELVQAEGNLHPLASQELAALRATPNGTTAEITYHGTRRFVSEASISAAEDQTPAITALGWVMIADQDPAEAFQLVTDSLRVAVLASLGVLIGAFILALLMANVISAPLKHISHAALDISAGNLSRRLDLQQRDEIGVLASSFNTMAESLDTRISAELAARTEAQRLQQVEAEQRQIIEQTLLDLQESFAVREQLNATIRDLSSPVLPVLDGILVMPLIGIINSERAELLLSSLLGAIEQQHAQIVILDVTGVPVIDSHIARALIQAADAGKLLGAQTILVGLRPELAQTIVGLGLNLSNMVTRVDLQSGVAYATQQRKHAHN